MSTALQLEPEPALDAPPQPSRALLIFRSSTGALMAACIALVLGFHSSSNLAAAYSVAITITMVITTLLVFVLVRDRWRWSLPAALLLCGAFFILDLAYFGANITKVDDGGWFPGSPESFDGDSTYGFP